MKTPQYITQSLRTNNSDSSKAWRLKFWSTYVRVLINRRTSLFWHFAIPYTDVENVQTQTQQAKAGHQTHQIFEYLF